MIMNVEKLKVSWWLLDFLLFNPEDIDSMFLRNVGKFQQNYVGLHYPQSKFKDAGKA
jgi:hypothetical protein